MNQKEGIYSDYPYLEKSNSKKKLMVISIIVVIIVIILALGFMFFGKIFSGKEIITQNDNMGIVVENIDETSDNPEYYNCLAVATRDKSYCDKSDNKENCILSLDSTIEDEKINITLCDSITRGYNNFLCKAAVTKDKNYCEVFR